MRDVIIIGAGPAGMAAGIYAKRAGLDVLVLNVSPVSGGQILNTYEVDNYPGLPGVSGMELGETMSAHCDKLGVEFASGRVSAINDIEGGKELVTKKNVYQTKTVIVATGASNQKLGVKGEAELLGAGVSYCATCDGAFFKEKTVAVVGGGDVALEDAIYLARGCKKVYLIHRRDEFRGQAVLAEEVKKTANIEILYNTVVEGINGDGIVDSIDISSTTEDKKEKLSVEGIFIAVGTVPNTAGIAGLPDLDERGYIIAGEDCRTSDAKIFAAGDVRTKQLRQVVTAVADGACAVTSIGRI